MNDVLIATWTLENGSERKTRITIELISSIDNNIIDYVAAAPPDYRASLSGTALPFPSQDAAFEGTVNKGQLKLLKSEKIEFIIDTPNSYYDGFTRELIPPTLILLYSIQSENKALALKLWDPIPFRTLTYDPKRENPLFYRNDLPVRSQEQILIDSAFQNEKPINFWGLKPAM